VRLILNRLGGGGTFGLVLEATTEASPRIPMQVAAVIFNTNQSSVLKQFLQILAANSLQWAHDSWGGYNQANYDGKGNTIFLYVNPVLNTSAAVKSIKPMTDWAAGLGNMTTLDSVLEVPSFNEFYTDFLATGIEVRLHHFFTLNF
jgi:FAD/FMN-containing dehydrogenase